MSKEPKPIIGGIFGTRTEWDEEGNVTVKDDFHLRIYWDLFRSGAIAKLKGNMLHVYLTIAMHLDNRGEGWPTQERIAQLCGINRDTVVNAIKKLVKAGFIESIKVRSKGKFDNTVYKIKFAPKTNDNNHDGKTVMVETPEYQDFHHDGKTDTEKPTRKNQHDKPDTKEDLSFKKDPSFKKEFDDDASRTPEKWETDFSYQSFRSIFVAAGASDIKKPAEHYNKFLAAVNSIGFGKLITAAEECVAVEGEQAQIVYFLSGHYNQYIQKPVSKKKSTNKAPKMPKSIKMGIAETAATSNLTPEELKQTYADIQKTMAFLRSTEKQVLQKKN